MSGIRSKDTIPELIVRKALFARGYRFRLHSKHLPGSPDIVLPKHHLVIFVHGCFWHLHQGCKYSRIPSSRADFWKEKLNANAARDKEVVKGLKKLGWRVLIVWECHIRGLEDIAELQLQLVRWIEGTSDFAELPVPADSSA